MCRQVLGQTQSGALNLYNLLHPGVVKSVGTARKIGSLSQFSEFSRLKTVFCHANFSTDEVSSIYNVHFDRKDKFIVSAGDEG